MTITRINENTLILELLREEVPKGSDKELLYHILNIAVSAENLDAKNCAFLLEGVESNRGLVFLLTVKGKRKRYKIKRYNEFSVYSFTYLDDFIACICAMYKANFNLPENCTYTMDGKYYICFLGKCLGDSVKILLSEFGEKEKYSNQLMARLREHGNVLTNRDSVRLMGESFTK